MYVSFLLASVYVLMCMFCVFGENGKADAKATIERAIAAHGGRAMLVAAQKTRIKAKGTEFEGTEVSRFEAVTWVDLPYRRKEVAQLTRGTREVSEIVVTTREKSWIKRGTLDAFDVTDRFHMYATRGVWLSYELTLVPLLEEKKLSLEAMGESMLEGRPVIGVRVSAKAERDHELFFDKSTYLLALVIDKIVPSTKDLPTMHQFFYDYKDFDGLKVATRRVVFGDGKKVQERIVLEMERLRTIDPAVFAKP